MHNYTPDADDDSTYYDNSLEGNVYGLASFICSCLLIIVAIFGLFGNVLTYWVFAKSSIVSSINILLAAQAVMDIVLLFVATPLFAVMGFYAYIKNRSTALAINVLVIYTYPFAMMAQTATVWATVVITFERYLAVCKPFKAMVICTTQNAKRWLVLVVTAAVGYNVCRFWEFRLYPDYTLEEMLRKKPVYMQVYYNWLYFFIIFFLPLVVLIILNGLIIRTIYRTQRQTYLQVNRQQHREYQTSVMMIVITFTFLVCNFLAFVLKLLENVCFESKLLENASCKSKLLENVSFESELLENICFESKVLKNVSFESNMSEFCEQPFYYFLIDVNNLLVEIYSSIPCLVYVSFSRCFRLRLVKMFSKFRIVLSVLTKPFRPVQQRFVRKNSSYFRISYSTHSHSVRLFSHDDGTTVITVDENSNRRKSSVTTAMKIH